MNGRTSLSKTLFMRGLQCPKALWLHKCAPERKGPMPPAYQRLLDMGVRVGEEAQRLFPGGEEVPYEGLSHAEQVARTRELIDGGTETIYEAAFGFDGVFVKVDILRKGEGGWGIYEVKASTEVHDHHIDDVAVQRYVLEGAGMDVASTHLVHIDNQYVRSGPVEPGRLFSSEDLTEPSGLRQGFVRDSIARLRDTLLGDEPGVPIGLQCDDPYPCDFKGYCWGHLPAYSVLDLSGSRKKKFALYHEGLIELDEIPEDRLSGAQRLERWAYLSREDVIDRAALGRFLDTLNYPLCFLDFETFSGAIPPLDGVRPYQQIPFQYSLHIQDAPGVQLIHREFLAEPGADPRRPLLERLLAGIPEGACVLAYNRTFEQTVLRSLQGWIPEHAERIEAVIDRLRDLAEPFRRKAVYRWTMKGSWSIKKVLPAFVPDLGYEGMAVADGDMAMNAWEEMGKTDDPVRLEGIRRDLLAYCRLDTLAMVRILEVLRAL